MHHVVVRHTQSILHFRATEKGEKEEESSALPSKKDRGGEKEKASLALDATSAALNERAVGNTTTVRTEYAYPTPTVQRCNDSKDDDDAGGGTNTIDNSRKHDPATESQFQISFVAPGVVCSPLSLSGGVGSSSSK